MIRERGAARAVAVAAVLLLAGSAALYVLMGPGGAPADLSLEPGTAGVAAAQDGGSAPAHPRTAAARSLAEVETVPEPAPDPPAAAAPAIPPGATGLTGRVIGTDGRPAVGVAIRVERQVEPAEAARFGVTVAAGEPHGRYLRDGITTGDDGRFLLLDVIAADDYVLTACAGAAIGSRTGCEAMDGVVRDVGDVALRNGTRVRGRVRSEAGAPIRGAAVFLGWGRSGRPFLCDDEGRFDAGVLFPGRTRVHVSAPGWTLPEIVHQDLLDGAETELELVMVRGAPLAGRVIDPAGRGIAGATVHRARRSSELGDWYGETLRSAADGSFLLQSPLPGTYDLTVRAEGYDMAVHRKVAPGEGPVEVKLASAGRVEGLVLDAVTGATVAGVELELQWIPPWMQQRGATAFHRHWRSEDQRSTAAGAFAFGVSENGRFRVAGSMDGYGQGFSEPFEMKEKQAVTGVIVRLERGLALEITVRGGPAMEPLAGALVEVFAPPPRNAVFSSAGPRGFQGRPQGRRVARRPTDDAGVARIDTLAAGSFDLVAAAPGFAPGRIEGVTLVAAVKPPALEVRLTAGGAVAGRVVNQWGEPEPAVRVVARNATDDEAEAVALEGGVYRIDHLAPGRYRVAVEDERDPGSAGLPFQGTPAGANLTDAERFPVVVDEGRTTEWEVAYERIVHGSLKGTVLVNGSPASGMQVSTNLQTEESGDRFFGFGLHGSVRTDDAGAFHVQRLKPGRYRVTVHRTWMKSYGAPEVVVAPAQETRVTIDLQLGGLRGRVVDAAGAPIEDAQVTVVRDDDSGQFAFGGAQATTSASGAFEMDELQSGTHQVSVRKKGYLTLEQEAVEVPARRIGGPLDLQLATGGWVNLQVVGADPAEVLRIELIRPNGEQVQMMSRQDAGSHWIEVGGTGAGTLTVTTRGATPRSAESAYTIEEGKNVELAIDLSPR